MSKMRSNLSCSPDNEANPHKMSLRPSKPPQTSRNNQQTPGFKRWLCNALRKFASAPFSGRVEEQQTVEPPPTPKEEEKKEEVGSRPSRRWRRSMLDAGISWAPGCQVHLGGVCWTFSTGSQIPNSDPKAPGLGRLSHEPGAQVFFCQDAECL